MNGRLQSLARGFDGDQILTLSLKGDFREAFDDMKDKEVTIEIKPFRKRRSLDANAMCWALVNQIAAKLQAKEPWHGWTPEEIYKDSILHVAGACTIHCLPNDQVDQIVEDWESLGIGFQVELFPSKVEGCTNGKFWKGSHVFNTQQMSTLINILIQQAEEQGVPTITENEVQKLLGNWDKKKKSTAKAVEK